MYCDPKHVHIILCDKYYVYLCIISSTLNIIHRIQCRTMTTLAIRIVLNTNYTRLYSQSRPVTSSTPATGVCAMLQICINVCIKCHSPHQNITITKNPPLYFNLVRFSSIYISTTPFAQFLCQAAKIFLSLKLGSSLGEERMGQHKFARPSMNPVLLKTSIFDLELFRFQHRVE